MARRRSSRSCWHGWAGIVGALLIVLFLVSSAVALLYAHDLRPADASEHSSHTGLRQALAQQLRPQPDLASGRPRQVGGAGGEAASFAVAGRAEERRVAVAPAPATRGGGAAVQSIRARAAAAAEAVEVVKDVPAEVPKRAAPGGNTITWKKHTAKSCQGYADDDSTERSLEASKALCLRMDSCVGIECPHGHETSCTLRAVANMVPFPPVDCYEQIETNAAGIVVNFRIHPAYNSLLREYPFQQVATQSGNQVNIILVRSQMNSHQIGLFEKYKNEILFMGISSMNDYPLNEKVDYLGMFPAFLHMMREPEKHFPPHVKTLLMSQSDFQLPNYPERDYSAPKKYDFTYSASDCDVASDGAGWCGWSKNWTFVREALKVMCGEFHLKGVLVATKDKQGRKAYTIPDSCKGLMTQTTYLANQLDYFNFLKNSKFAFLPQVHDASPRVSTQALAMDVPILMNWYIGGGWKYVNDKTGEFFHDLSDFRQSLQKILQNSQIPKRYEPRKWVRDNYGNWQSGKRLLEFVREHFSDRVRLPKGTKALFI